MSCKAILTSSLFLSTGWTIKTKTVFNKVSPVTILGHSFLLNNEGKELNKNIFLYSKYEVCKSVFRC